MAALANEYFTRQKGEEDGTEASVFLTCESLFPEV